MPWKSLVRRDVHTSEFKHNIFHLLYFSSDSSLKLRLTPKWIEFCSTWIASLVESHRLASFLCVDWGLFCILGSLAGFSPQWDPRKWFSAVTDYSLDFLSNNLGCVLQCRDRGSETWSFFEVGHHFSVDDTSAFLCYCFSEWWIITQSVNIILGMCSPPRWNHDKLAVIGIQWALNFVPLVSVDSLRCWDSFIGVVKQTLLCMRIHGA